MNVVAVAHYAAERGADELCAATAYRDWCGRFDPHNIPVADENLAVTLSRLGRHDEAIPVLRRVRAENLRQLRGSENEKSVASLLNLTVSLGCSGRNAEAIRVLREARPAACQALGEDHHLCLSLGKILGYAHYNRGIESSDATELLAAGAIFRDLILRSRKVLGSEHPETCDRESFFVMALEALEKAGCEADILEKLCSGVLRGGWHSKEYEPRSRPGPWKGSEPSAK